jgi:hypothetical protein
MYICIETKQQIDYDEALDNHGVDLDGSSDFTAGAE